MTDLTKYSTKVSAMSDRDLAREIETLRDRLRRDRRRSGYSCRSGIYRAPADTAGKALLCKVEQERRDAAWKPRATSAHEWFLYIGRLQAMTDWELDQEMDACRRATFYGDWLNPAQRETRDAARAAMTVCEDEKARRDPRYAAVLAAQRNVEALIAAKRAAA